MGNESNSNELIEPATLKELKIIIKDEYNNCIVFFPSRGREHFRCDFCIINLEVAARYSQNCC